MAKDHLDKLKEENKERRKNQEEKVMDDTISKLEKKYYDLTKTVFEYSSGDKKSCLRQIRKAVREQIDFNNQLIKEEMNAENASKELEKLGIPHTLENAESIRRIHIEEEVDGVRPLLDEFIENVKRIQSLDANNMKFQETQELVDKIKTISNSCATHLKNLNLDFTLPTSG
jgi:hypothetical protein